VQPADDLGAAAAQGAVALGPHFQHRRVVIGPHLGAGRAQRRTSGTSQGYDQAQSPSSGGIGEIGITGVGAAVANAVYHATGARVRDLPITLDKLLAINR
jgi:hypothetical protein